MNKVLTSTIHKSIQIASEEKLRQRRSSRLFVDARSSKISLTNLHLQALCEIEFSTYGVPKPTPFNVGLRCGNKTSSIYIYIPGC